MISANIKKLSIAVVVHLYYLDLWPEICEALTRLPSWRKIFITTTKSQIDEVKKCVHQNFPEAQIYGFINRGRDIGPLLELMKVERLEDFDLVLKIHSKKSLHNIAGEKDVGEYWRKNFLNQLIPYRGLDDILTYFDSQPHVGMAGPREFILSVGSSLYSKDTQQWFLHLLKILGSPKKPELELFFAGTMFWARGQVFGALRSLGLQQSDIEAETGQLDGTLAHAVERIFPLLAKSVGLHTKAFPIWDYRNWLDSRVPLPGQMNLINNYLLNNNGGPQILLIIIDNFNESEIVELTLKSLEVMPSLGLNLRTLTLRDRSSLQEVIHSLKDEWFFVVDAGTELTKSGLLMVVQKILQNPFARAVFADEMTLLPNGKLHAVLRPDINLDLLLNCPGFMSHHWLFKANAVSEVGGFGRNDSTLLEFDLILRLIEKSGFHDLLHVPEPLLITKKTDSDLVGAEAVILRHLHARNYLNARIDSKVSGLYRIEYGHEHQPLVSIMIAVCDELSSLIGCVESLLSVTAYPNYEIIITDNRSQASETTVWLESVAQLDKERIRVISMAEKATRAQVYNRSYLEAKGEYLLFLNFDASFDDPYWLDMMLNHAQRPEVGVVGPRLFHPLQLIQYAGFILGLRSVVSRPFINKSLMDDKNSNRFIVDQNYSALPDICFLIKRTVFEELGGFDEVVFGDFYADCDLCLKAITAGYLNVWTPNSKVNYAGYVNHENIRDNSPKMLKEVHEEQRETFFQKWVNLIASDPAYNPNYSFFGEGFSVDDRKKMFIIDNDSRWSPLSWRPLPIICAQPSDRNGSGHYRVIQPFNALKFAGLVDGVIEDTIAISIEAARLKPDIVVFQSMISDTSLSELRRMKRRQDFFVVMDLDDYLLNIPIKNESKNYHSNKDIVKKIKEGLSLADRFVVSTQGLAETFKGLHTDIVVSELKLPTDWWGNLYSSRGISQKPRVGWAGGTSHTGDLEMVTDVVKALAGEVDWIFLGMCPEALRPWVKEVHSGVPIALYPEKLASLSLDLAIAPLENNHFNDCKSNLRLLEYGACAYPVVCSNTRAYRESGLPVTVVKNRFKDWVSAIRMYTNDLDEAKRCGQKLRQAVLSDWMLRDTALQQWRNNWCPD